jgi:hypothetical protein
MVRIISMEELRRGGGATRFEGHAYGSSVSFFVTDAREGRGPDLHRHPCEVPPGAAHKFRTGAEGMRSVNIHGSDRMSQEDLPE